jgi:hypothetical protein
VYIGLGTCVAEMAFVSNELLRHESLHLHRAMVVLFEGVFVTVVCMSTGVPHCR